MISCLRQTKTKPRLLIFILIAFTLSSVSAEALVTPEQVAKLYVATFNRAPDAEGLNYWVNNSFTPETRTIENIAMSFFDQPETQALYPAGTTNEAFVTAIYHNLFNREPDPGGFAWWTGPNGLGGGIPRSVMIEAMKNGAQNSEYGNDADILANKTEAGLYYVSLGLDGDDFSLAGITDSLSTLNAAKQSIDSIAASSILEGNIEKYMAMVSSAGNLTPMVDEVDSLLEEIMNGNSSAVTISPALDINNLDLETLPSAIKITADFGNGYTPENSTSVFTGKAVIDITHITFSLSGISAKALISATNVKRDNQLILNGDITLDFAVVMSGNNMTINADVKFYNLKSLDVQLYGGILVNVSPINMEDGTFQSIIITFNQFSTQDLQLSSGTITLTRNNDLYDASFNLDTDQGAVSGTLQVDNSNPDQTVISTPGTFMVGQYSLDINDVIMAPDTCPESPIGGNIVITGDSETKTVTFNNCIYTIN